MSSLKNISVSIIGGNIAGLSAAYYLAKNGCPVTIYESKIWDKPCGGAISIEFAKYLNQELSIALPELDRPIPRVKFGFMNGKGVETEGVFIITSRYHLQEKLIQRLQKEQNIEFVFKRISARDKNLFSQQTVLATGFSGLTKKLIKNEWQNREIALTLKHTGKFDKTPGAACHLLLFNSRIHGYGWVFLENNDAFNLGIGGLIDKSTLYKSYDEFLYFISKTINYPIDLPDGKPKLWKLPICVNTWHSPVAFVNNGFEFVGVGDVLGLAHPFIAAGIEPAWQSGWLIGESYDPIQKKIIISKYRHLLTKNHQLTCRKRIDLLLAKMLRANHFPLKTQLSYMMLRVFKKIILQTLKDYPWFAMVHDGDQKTNFRI